MVLIGFSDTLSLAQSIGIVGTMVLTLYFSKRQIQALSSDQETRVRKISQYGNAHHGRPFYNKGDRHTRLLAAGNGFFLLYYVDLCSRLCNATEKGA